MTLQQARVLHDYIARTPSELSLEVGALVLIKTRKESGWWYGASNGSRGWFPSTFVEFIDVSNPSQALQHLDSFTEPLSPAHQPQPPPHSPQQQQSHAQPQPSQQQQTHQQPSLPAHAYQPSQHHLPPSTAPRSLFQDSTAGQYASSPQGDRRQQQQPFVEPTSPQALRHQNSAFASPRQQASFNAGGGSPQNTGRSPQSASHYSGDGGAPGFGDGRPGLNGGGGFNNNNNNNNNHANTNGGFNNSSSNNHHNNGGFNSNNHGSPLQQLTHHSSLNNIPDLSHNQRSPSPLHRASSFGDPRPASAAGYLGNHRAPSAGGYQAERSGSTGDYPGQAFGSPQQQPFQGVAQPHQQQRFGGGSPGPGSPPSQQQQRFGGSPAGYAGSGGGGGGPASPHSHSGYGPAYGAGSGAHSFGNNNNNNNSGGGGGGGSGVGPAYNSSAAAPPSFGGSSRAGRGSSFGGNGPSYGGGSGSGPAFGGGGRGSGAGGGQYGHGGSSFGNAGGGRVAFASHATARFGDGPSEMVVVDDKPSKLTRKLQKADLLNLANHDKIRKLLGNESRQSFHTKEEVMLSSILEKINRKGKVQKRVMLVTNRCMYNLLTTDYGTCKRCIGLEQLGSLTVSSTSQRFVVHVPVEYDYYYHSTRVDEVIEHITHAYQFLVGRELPVVYTDDFDLSVYVRNKVEAMHGIRKAPCMGMTKEEVAVRDGTNDDPNLKKTFVVDPRTRQTPGLGKSKAKVAQVKLGTPVVVRVALRQVSKANFVHNNKPMIVLYAEDSPESGTFGRPIAITERHSHTPLRVGDSRKSALQMLEYLETFRIGAECPLRLKFEVIKPTDPHDPLAFPIVMADHIVSASELLNAPRMSYTADLGHPQSGKPFGQLVVFSEVEGDVKEEVRLEISGRSITCADNDTFGIFSSPPCVFLQICREHISGRCFPVFKSKVAARTRDPQLEPVEAKLSHLANGRLDYPLLFEVFDANENGTGDYIGSFVTTLNEMKATTYFDLKYTRADGSEHRAGILLVRMHLSSTDGSSAPIDGIGRFAQQEPPESTGSQPPSTGYYSGGGGGDGRFPQQQGSPGAWGSAYQNGVQAR